MIAAGVGNRTMDIAMSHFPGAAIPWSSAHSVREMSFIVLFMRGSLLRRSGRCYRKESVVPLGAAIAVEPVLDRLGALAAFIDRPHDQRLAAPRIPRRKNAVG